MNCKRKQESKKKRKKSCSRPKNRPRKRSRKKESFLFISWTLSWSRVCFLSFFLDRFYNIIRRDHIEPKHFMPYLAPCFRFHTYLDVYSYFNFFSYLWYIFRYRPPKSSLPYRLDNKDVVPFRTGVIFRLPYLLFILFPDCAIFIFHSSDDKMVWQGLWDTR